MQNPKQDIFYVKGSKPHVRVYKVDKTANPKEYFMFVSYDLDAGNQDNRNVKTLLPITENLYNELVDVDPANIQLKLGDLEIRVTRSEE